MQRVVSEMLRHREEVRRSTASSARWSRAPSLARWRGGWAGDDRVLGRVGDPLDFHHAGAYEKACGLNPEQSSGTAARRLTSPTAWLRVRAQVPVHVRCGGRSATARPAPVERRQSLAAQGGKVSALVALMRKVVNALAPAPWGLRGGQALRSASTHAHAPGAGHAHHRVRRGGEAAAPCPPTHDDDDDGARAR